METGGPPLWREHCRSSTFRVCPCRATFPFPSTSCLRVFVFNYRNWTFALAEQEGGVMAVDTAKYKVIGTRPVRPDGVDKVTGRAVYGADVVLPRMAVGKMLRSPHAQAIIKRIDTSRAEALKGVLAVATSADLPDVNATTSGGEGGEVNLKHSSSNVLARDKALYHGHAIAAVAATSPHIA